MIPQEVFEKIWDDLEANEKEIGYYIMRGHLGEDTVSFVLEQALPHLKEMIAQELESDLPYQNYDSRGDDTAIWMARIGYKTGYDHAINVLRGIPFDEVIRKKAADLINLIDELDDKDARLGKLAPYEHVIWEVRDGRPS